MYLTQRCQQINRSRCLVTLRNLQCIVEHTKMIWFQDGPTEENLEVVGYKWLRRGTRCSMLISWRACQGVKSAQISEWLTSRHDYVDTTTPKMVLQEVELDLIWFSLYMSSVSFLTCSTATFLLPFCKPGQCQQFDRDA